MTYLLIIMALVAGLVLFNEFLRKISKAPEDIITYFFQALEVEALAYSVDNDWPSQLKGDNLDKTLLVTSGYFYALSKPNTVQLSISEIELIASFTIVNRPNDKGNKKVGRLIVFVVLYKLALQLKKKNIPISQEEDSMYMRKINKFDSSTIDEKVHQHMRNEAAPVSHQLLTTKLIDLYPKWVQMEFN